MNTITRLITALVLLSLSTTGLAGPTAAGPKGLNAQAKKALIAAGVNKYMGQFSPAASFPVGQGWTQHIFDPGLDEGPVCIAGTPYSVYSKIQDPKKLLIMMQGGGACWQDFYNCNVLAEDQAAPPPPGSTGIWTDSFDTGSEVIPNPIADWSIVYMPYCDGSVFAGDNAVVDFAFQADIEAKAGLPPGTGPFIRFHRGLRNATAGVDIARKLFPAARHIMLAGSSAGGVGAAALTPFLVRLAFRGKPELMVFNDAGPVAINLLDVDAILARASDWDFGQFFPASCTDCDAAAGQGTAIIKWRLDNDSTIRESFYSTDGDSTNRFFLNVPTQELYRQLILTEHGALHAAHPDRYKRFIRSGDASHTALQTPLFYVGTANGVPLHEWVKDFLLPPDEDSAWVDIVEDFVPLP